MKRTPKRNRTAAFAQPDVRRSQPAVATCDKQKIPAEAIERLRKSHDRVSAENREYGQSIGRDWALKRAEADELENLRRFREEHEEGWASFFEAQDYCPALEIFEAMCPDCTGSQQDFHEFSESLLGNEARYLQDRNAGRSRDNSSEIVGMKKKI